MANLSKLIIATVLLVSIQPLPAYGQDVQSLLKDRVSECVVFATSLRYQEYIDCLRPLSDAGSVEAATRLMSIYLDGTAVTVDHVNAAKYAAIGAAADDTRSLKVLAILKSVGLGTTKNWEEALRLRRREAQLRSAMLPPLRVAGEFTGNQVTETESILASVVVGSNGVIQSCAAAGQSENLKNLTCKVITKYFAFLPAVNANGTDIDWTWKNPINFKAVPKSTKISTVIPARVLSGEILISDFTRYKISRTGLQKLQLEIDLTKTGAIISCNARSSDKVFGTYACKIVREKFKFTPATLPSGVKKGSKFNLELDLDFPAAPVLPNVRQAQPQNVSPPPPKGSAAVTAPVQNTTAAPSATGDVILDTAINRCDRIGFKRDTSEFRGCVTEQISLLSK